MKSKLEEIMSKTKEELVQRKQRTSLDILKKSLGAQKFRPFVNAVRNPKLGTIAIIAEIKFASPTESHLGSPDRLLERAKQYEVADAISVVTEKHFFHGDPAFIAQIKSVTSLPVLQKDFIIDEYQLYEVAKNGADAILLIAKLLSGAQLLLFVKLAQKLGIEPVVEINDELDLEKAKLTTTRIIAVNARDLHSFIVDVDRACKLMKKIPDQFIKLGFSGVNSRTEIKKYKQAGACGVLIGTSLMKTQKIANFMERVRV